MADVESGIAREIAPGIYIGATDLQEMAADAGMGIVPASMTLLGTLGGGGGVLDETGAGEGFVMFNPDNGAFSLTIDGYDGLFHYGEVLMRCFLDSGSDQFDHFGGPGAINLVNSAYNFLSMAGDNDVNGNADDQAQSGVGTASINMGASLPRYYWLRMRTEDAGGGMVRFRIQVGAGDAQTPPVVGTWQLDETIVQEVNFTGPANIGVGMVRRTVGGGSVRQRKFGYVGFSTDPDNYPVPDPSEVFPQGTDFDAVVVITELQGTWATGEIGAVEPAPTPDPADFRTLTIADTPWDWIDGDFQIFANPAGGVLRINLPDAAAYIATGHFNPVHVKNIGAPSLDINTEYVQVFGINGNTIDGFTDVINRLQQTNHTFVTDGLNWYLQ